VIDFLIVYGVATGALWLAGFDLGAYYEQDVAWLVSTAKPDVIFALAGAAVALAYYLPLMLRWEGGTVGKRALGIRVVRADGAPLRARQVLVRQVAIQFLVCGFVLPANLLNYLWPPADRQNRALHDLVVDTRVVRS